MQNKCLLIRNNIRLPFTCFSIPMQNFSQQYKCFWKLTYTYGVLCSCGTLLSLKGSVNVEWSACKSSLAKIYLKDNKSKSLQSWYIYCLNTDFSVRAKTYISDVTVRRSFCSTPKATLTLDIQRSLRRCFAFICK